MKKSLRTLVLPMLLLAVTAVVTPAIAKAESPRADPDSPSLGDVAPSPILPSATPVPATPVVSLSARLYDDESMTHLYAEIVDGVVYLGCAGCGAPYMFFDGMNIYWGGSASGELLFCVHGDYIAAGGIMNGTIVYTIRGRHIFEGEVTATPLYTLDGDRMLAGDGQTGQLILRADRRLEDSGVRFLLPVLLDVGSR